MTDSPSVRIGGLTIGAGAPIAVQSMTNTNTADAQATAKQVLELAQAGSEMVRFTVMDEDGAKAVPVIRDIVRENGSQVPLIGDFHYNGHLLLTKYPQCAQALDKYRINPGNIGVGSHHNKNFLTMIEIAAKNDKAVRIGVNGGSLDQELLARLIDEDNNSSSPKGAKSVFLDAMVQSTVQSAKLAEEYGVSPNKIVLSAKVSEVNEVVEVYRRLKKAGKYALHVGLTEAGMGLQGIVSSTLALGALLTEGIGDTIRVSLTPAPGESRTQEVIVAREILQNLHLRFFTPHVTSCPGCGRTSSDSFQWLAREVQQYVRQRSFQWQQLGYTGFEHMKIAVMGCIVNGPGEAKNADLAISLPGNGEYSKAIVFANGKKIATLGKDNLLNSFKDLIEKQASQCKKKKRKD